MLRVTHRRQPYLNDRAKGIVRAMGMRPAETCLQQRALPTDTGYQARADALVTSFQMRRRLVRCRRRNVGGEQMAAGTRGNDSVNLKEPLGVLAGLEPAHSPLALTGGLMRVLGAVHKINSGVVDEQRRTLQPVSQHRSFGFCW